MLHVATAAHFLHRLCGIAAALAIPWNNPGVPDGAEHAIKLSIGLKPAEINALEKTLLSVSDPSNDRFGKHLSREDAKELLRPDPESAEEVQQWLIEAGVLEDQLFDDGQFIYAYASAEAVWSLFGAHSTLLGRDLDMASQILQNSAPLKVRHHITVIQPSFEFGDITPQGNTMYPKFPLWPRKISVSSPRLDERIEQSASTEQVDPELCNTKTTPTCLQKLYQIDDGRICPHKKSLLGIAGFNGQAAQFTELEHFIEQFAPYAAGGNFSVAYVNGGQNPQGEYPSGEANLDVQYAMAMAPGIPVRYYTTGGEKHDFIPDLDIADTKTAYVEPYLEFARYLLDLEDDELPQVISISYGINEQVLPRAYAQQVCNIFGQLGTRGVSVIVASGDTGPGVSCQSNDGKNTTKFLPMFPASCPYVTVVGGTEGSYPETATWFSSGGFSQYFPRPQWQTDAIRPYLGNDLTQWKGLFNANGRGYPDISARAVNYQIMNHGKVEAANGTSAAAPLIAAMIARLNNCRFARGKPALGFLNPWIYGSARNAFIDITSGKSIGCEGESWWGLSSPVVHNAGWSAVRGWDPVTGLGTPLFDRLKHLSCPQE
ncbi:Tripeptidyl-peptidase SED2 [Paramyrothecium foliicola]|nr:Tripeptidyl-peptidase SED2 [Paramyrothecium foliicola]